MEGAQGQREEGGARRRRRGRERLEGTPGDLDELPNNLVTPGDLDELPCSQAHE